jgi:hypothetical protein
VSIVKLGPRKSKKCESLLDCMANAQPKHVSMKFQDSSLESFAYLWPDAFE